MSYTVLIERKASKALARIDRNARNRIEQQIAALTHDPRPDGCKKLQATNLYRIRVGNYRIIYRVQADILIVTVINAGHRSHIYRDIGR